MKWNAEYAALRFFRRHGAEVRIEHRMIIFCSPPKWRNIGAYKRNKTVLEKAGYGFTESLFIH